MYNVQARPPSLFRNTRPPSLNYYNIKPKPARLPHPAPFQKNPNLKVKGLIYNTRYDLTLLKKTNAKDETNIQIQLDNISTRIKSKFYKDTIYLLLN